MTDGGRCEDSPMGEASHLSLIPIEESESAVYAIVRSGGQQQKVAVGDVIEIDKVATQPGETLSLPVVLVVDGDTVTSDADALAKVDVQAEVVGNTKGPKITILKFKNKTGYRKRQGHRQKYTQVKVTAINTK
jgi:large subunit ribosomal protein L21